MRAVCVAKAAADAARATARVLWADEPNHLPAGQYSDFFLPMPGVAVDAGSESEDVAQRAGWQSQTVSHCLVAPTCEWAGNWEGRMHVATWA